MARSFPPIAGADAATLILGSMPGQASLDAGRYYAHPRNAFWPIMGELFAARPELEYSRRMAVLREARVFFNGAKAAELFESLVVPTLGHVPLHQRRLPSTSPAHAGMSFAEKLAAWRVVASESSVAVNRVKP